MVGAQRWWWCAVSHAPLQLGFAECPKSYVFRGTKDYEPTQVMELLGLGAGGAAAAAARRPTGPSSAGAGARALQQWWRSGGGGVCAYVCVSGGLCVCGWGR